MDLALSNLQWLICHKTKPNQTKSYTEASYTQRVGAPTTSITSTTEDTFRGLCCFVHVICAPQTSTYQNITKLLT